MHIHVKLLTCHIKKLMLDLFISYLVIFLFFLGKISRLHSKKTRETQHVNITPSHHLQTNKRCVGVWLILITPGPCATCCATRLLWRGIHLNIVHCTSWFSCLMSPMITSQYAFRVHLPLIPSMSCLLSLSTLSAFNPYCLIHCRVWRIVSPSSKVLYFPWLLPLFLQQEWSK